MVVQSPARRRSTHAIFLITFADNEDSNWTDT